MQRLFGRGTKNLKDEVFRVFLLFALKHPEEIMQYRLLKFLSAKGRISKELTNCKCHGVIPISIGHR